MKTPFELRDLHQFVTVVKCGSFTEAARILGLSQSALTRQIQNLESRLGIQLISRTTRSLRLTEAGSYWMEQSRQILDRASLAQEGFAEQFIQASPTVKVGVCRTIGLAYLPGFFHAFRKRHPECQIHLEQRREEDLIHDLDSCALDLVIAAQPPGLPGGIEITHSFEDAFVLIGPANPSGKGPDPSLPSIQIDSQTTTGKLIADWQRREDIQSAPMMEFDHFDLIIHSVILGLGMAIVPRRSLAIYSRNRKIQRYQLERPLSRTLCALARSENNRPKIIQALIDSILF